LARRRGRSARSSSRSPPDYPDDDLRGKTGAFSARVSQVAEKILPPLDDEFAKTVGVATLADLDKAVRGELAHASFHEGRDAAAEKLLAHLLDSSTVEVPEVLIADELDHLIADLKGRVKDQRALVGAVPAPGSQDRG